MSGTAAKASRRDLRKAFGGAAIDTLDAQAEALGRLDARILELYEYVETIRRGHETQFEGQVAIFAKEWARVDDEVTAIRQTLDQMTEARMGTDQYFFAVEARHDTELARLGTRVYGFTHATLWARLRWLVTGR